MKRLAVVLFNLGGPDSPGAVRPFLFNLFNDAAIITLPQPFRWLLAALISTLRAKTARDIYAQIGGSSPLLAETEAQAAALQTQLSARFPDAAVKVVIAMRYWRPFTQEAAREVEAFAPDDVVLLPLYPQFSTTTTGSSLAEWRKLYKGPAASHAVCCYADSEGLIEAHAQRILQTAPSLDNLRVIFSAHGLPEKVIQGGDPYQQQIELSAQALARRIGAKDWRVSYQSRVGPLKWIGPSTIETLQAAAKDGVGVLVVPIAFVSEHSETLVELDREYRELALHAGVLVYLRAPAIGIEPAYIEALADMTVRALGCPGVGPQATPCTAAFRQCPFQHQPELRAG